MEGARLKELRKNLGLSQEEMAARIGLSKSGISNIEKGKRVLIDRNIRLIVAEFGVNETWLRTGEGRMFIAEPDIRLYNQLLHDPSLDDLDKKILKVYVKLPKSYRTLLKEHVLRLANELASMPYPGEQITLEDQIEGEVDAYREELRAEQKEATSYPSAVSGE